MFVFRTSKTFKFSISIGPKFGNHHIITLKESPYLKSIDMLKVLRPIYKKQEITLRSKTSGELSKNLLLKIIYSLYTIRISVTLNSLRSPTNTSVRNENQLAQLKNYHRTRMLIKKKSRNPLHLLSLSLL